MFKAITCYLSGRHEYHVSCEPGAIFLRCYYCGQRSSGWELRHEREMAKARLEGPRAVEAMAPAARGLR
jgi:hypothetical protein